MNSQKSGCGCLPIMGLITALAIGGGYVYQKGWHQLLFSRSLTPLTGATVIPDEAVMTSFISTNSKHWQQLEKLGIEQTPKVIEQVTTDIEKELSASNINYRNDLESWLGNAMLAVVPETQSPGEQNLLVVLGIKNPINAYKFLKKVQNNEGEALESVNYKGIKINLITNSQGNQNNLALLGNKIVISNETATVKQAIDTFKGEPSFASDAENQAVLKQPLKLKNNLVNVYLPNYDRLLVSNLEEPVSKEKLAHLQPVESVVVGIGVSEKELKLQSFTTLNPNLKLPKYQPVKNKIASNFPEQTIAFINSQGINTFWTTLVTISEEDKDFKQAIDGMRVSTRWLTGLDLDEDVFGWMDGEFAIGIVPTKQVMIPELSLKSGLAFILESSDRDTAENTLNAINNQLQQQVGLVSQTKQINKQTVTQLSVPYTNVDVSYGWLDNNNLLLTVGNNVFESMDSSSTSSLQNSSNFKQLAQKFPNKNLSYFYLDMEKALAEIKQISELYLDNDSESMVILNSIQSIGSVSKMADANTTKTELIVLFK
ncbi:conserved hypothetical protein [Hyella patelloides LEGE 07179]|uniref:DUF3352 domain-containing protein n=1 Tax=Hyella patelloides LEGE 07179 TaxID=945734 RepID=A0A563VVS5_9CYAN|nr:DUF3352 domain-containing protein [Hyella patelloides]VEP15363.1 conserved hypothetical protein [Hyella patelloides LEGE 07179]